MQSRYRLQKDHFTCGPVAIHNAQVWQQGKADRWTSLMHGCKPDPEYGTAVKRMHFGKIVPCTTKRERMRQWVQKDGHGILLLCGVPVDKKHAFAHYIFVHPHATNKVMIRNGIGFDSGPDYRHFVMSWDQFAKIYLQPCHTMLNGDSHNVPIAWRFCHS